MNPAAAVVTQCSMSEDLLFFIKLVKAPVIQLASFLANLGFPFQEHKIFLGYNLRSFFAQDSSGEEDEL